MDQHLRGRLDKRTGRKILCGRNGCSGTLGFVIQVPQPCHNIGSPEQIPFRAANQDSAIGLPPPGDRLLFVDAKSHYATKGKGYKIAILDTHKRESGEDGRVNFILTQSALSGRLPKNALKRDTAFANEDGGSSSALTYQSVETKLRSNTVNVLPVFIECPDCRKRGLSKTQSLNLVDEGLVDQIWDRDGT